MEETTQVVRKRGQQKGARWPRPEGYVGFEEARQRLGVTPRTLERWLANGRVPHVKGTPASASASHPPKRYPRWIPEAELEALKPKRYERADADQLLTLKEAAKISQRAYSTLQGAVHTGRLPVVVLAVYPSGDRVLGVRRADLHDYMQRPGRGPRRKMALPSSLLVE
jgi:hypothetical protein